METITSRDNQRLINARRVRDGKDDTRIFIEGRRLVAEALRSGIQIEECFIAKSFNDQELPYELAAQTELIVSLSDKLFRTIADTDNSQGIALIAERPEGGLDAFESKLKSGEAKLPIVLFLKEINNPSNLGAVLRTAEAAGVAGVLISTGSADVYSPKAIRAAMGSAFRLPVHSGIEYNDAIKWAERNGLIATATEITTEVSYTNIDWNKPRMLIFGSEAHGLTLDELSQVHDRIYIPMENGVESLNLAVSAGVILFEAKRRIAKRNDQ